MVIVGMATGLVSSLRSPIFRATASVLLTPNDPNQQLNPSAASGMVGSDPDRYAAGQISIVRSAAVATEAAKSLQGVTPVMIDRRISVSQSGQSNVLSISARDSDPAQASDIADAVAKGYIENRRLAAVFGLQAAAKDIADRLAPLQATIGQLDTQIGESAPVSGATSQLVSPIPPASATGPTPATAQIKPPSSVDSPASSQEALKAARYAAAVQYETLYSREQELLVDISLKRGDAELIAVAKTPVHPISPRPKRDAALGVFVGLLIGVGIALLREQLNDKVRSPEEVERLTGLPLLAHLPLDEQATMRLGLAVDQRPNCVLSEAIRSLRTAVQYQGVDRPATVIVVTSASPGEGKSLIAANLAAAFAKADYRTLLVSADLRRPTINDVFGDLGPSPGLIGIISQVTSAPTPVPNGKTAREVGTAGSLLKTPIAGLLLLPSGPQPPNPAELLGSRRMGAILAELADLSDIVIIDTPPLLPVTDAAVIAAKCDGVILVAAVNESRRNSILRAKAILDATGARLLGVVVNKVSSKAGGYYGENYYTDRSKDERPPSDSERGLTRVRRTRAPRSLPVGQ